jgi:Domain of unknown function (DUF4352)
MRAFHYPLVLTVVALAALSSCADSDQKQGPIQTFNMGEKATVGQIVYMVYETQWLTQLGDGPDARLPQNRFFLVRLNAVNNSSRQVNVPNFSLVDDTGATYPEISDETRAVPQYIGFLRRVRPAEAAQGHALFDAPPQHYKLKVMDEDGEHSAFVDIPLSFSSDSPEVPGIVDGKKSLPTPLLPKR